MVKIEQVDILPHYVTNRSSQVDIDDDEPEDAGITIISSDSEDATE